jgi:hypothetical protein
VLAEDSAIDDTESAGVLEAVAEAVMIQTAGKRELGTDIQGSGNRVIHPTVVSIAIKSEVSQVKQ